MPKFLQALFFIVLNDLERIQQLNFLNGMPLAG